MKSPITGNDMVLVKEPRTMGFRKKEYTVNYHYYLCPDSNEQFTSEHLDEINLMQVYNQYRVEHKLPFPEEIRALRESYALSATKMAEVLGFGVNTYRNYEQGEVPNESSARLIQVVQDPEEFEKIISLSGVLSGSQLERVKGRIHHWKEERAKEQCIDLESYFMGELLPDEFSGYKKPSLERLVEAVVFFAQRLSPWKTKLNKLLFYSDFLHFKEYGVSLTGSRYCAIQLGPVPKNFQSVFEYAASRGIVKVEEKSFRNGGVGEMFSIGEDRE
ncbi:MAG: DUF4065 domain-containing protein, partial [Chlorobiales bacterium]|nr:DUF4065 domain-containing protein [Chlorobiales bacterium]